MCQPTVCRTCGLAGWRGCGRHVDQVLAGVPRCQRCQGHATEARAGGLLRRLLGR